MEFIKTQGELTANSNRLSEYLREGSGPNADFAKALVQRGICFVVSRIDGKDFFAPSRFVGYAKNNRQDHILNHDKDGRDTNPVISDIIGTEPHANTTLERGYTSFCHRFSIEVRPAGNFGVARKFWDIR